MTEGNQRAAVLLATPTEAPLPRSFPGPPRAVRGEIKRVACKYVLFNYGKEKARGRTACASSCCHCDASYAPVTWPFLCIVLATRNLSRASRLIDRRQQTQSPDRSHTQQHCTADSASIIISFCCSSVDVLAAVPRGWCVNSKLCVFLTGRPCAP